MPVGMTGKAREGLPISIKGKKKTMLKYIIIRRLLWLPLTMLAVATIVFFLMRVVPGDPALLIAGPWATPAQVEKISAQLGLDKPLYTQYLVWLWKLSHGDLGISLLTRSSVLGLIVERLPRTLELTITALGIAVLLFIPMGVIAAIRAHSWTDYLPTGIAVFGISFPVFWLGIMLILIFGVILKILPISGSGGPIGSISNLRHLVLPAFTLGFPYGGELTRLGRSSMLEVLSQDYIRTARSKGLNEFGVVFKHAFRNALIPTMTLLGLRIPWLFGGAVVTETVFAWPGIGQLLVRSIYGRDFPVVEGIVLILAFLVTTTNIIVDISYFFIDPRIRYN